MAKVERRDVREYYLMATGIDVSTNGVIVNWPVPVSATLVDLRAICEVSPSAGFVITIQLRGVTIPGVSGSPTMIIPASDVPGRHKVEKNSADGVSRANEAQDGDALEAGGTLQVTSNGLATGTYTFLAKMMP